MKKNVQRKTESGGFPDWGGLWESNLGFCLTQNLSLKNREPLALDFRNFDDFFLFSRKKISQNKKKWFSGRDNPTREWSQFFSSSSVLPSGSLASKCTFCSSKNDIYSCIGTSRLNSGSKRESSVCFDVLFHSSALNYTRSVGGYLEMLGSVRI